MSRQSVQIKTALMALLAIAWLPTPTPAEAASSPLAECWRKMPVAAGTLVDLTLPTAGAAARLLFQTTEDVKVSPVSEVSGGQIAPGELVELEEAKGQIVLDAGQVTATAGTSRYRVDKSDGPQLNAQPGTRLKLEKAVASSDGKFALPADSSLNVVLKTGEPVSAQVAADIMLWPAGGNAWLRAGFFPVVSGGRSVQARFHEPGATASELSTRAFEACVKYQDGNSERVEPTGVDVVSSVNGIATLAIWMPASLGHGFGWIWQSVEVTALDTTTGLLAGPVSVHVGNPLISAAFAVVLTALLIVIVGKLIGPKTQRSWSWASSLIDEGGGRKSLALFQIAAWTLLVLIGMLYVMAMSGNLLNVSEEMLVLLGLAGVGTVAARWINPVPDKASETGFASMFFVGDKPDLTRLQMFLFTLLIWIYVAWRILSEQAFPELGANVLLLMGISSGVYVAAKWAQTTEQGQDLLAAARRLRLTLDTLNDGIAIKKQEISIHQSTVKATQDAAGNPLPGSASENAEAKAALTKAQGELAALEADLAKARTDWTNELEGLKTK